MRIVIDIGHPGHVHYFRNFISIMRDRGHEFLVVARDKEVTYKLLDYYKIPYVRRGKGGKGILGKIIYIFIADFYFLKFSFRFKPDMFMSFSSTYAGHMAFLFHRPHILFDDTEHAKYEHFMYKPFADAIVTPACFYKNMGRKHIFFNGYMELCYLHPNYFQPQKDILDLLQITENEKYVIVRFVSWDASHDMGQKGFDITSKINLVKELNRIVRVFISSESGLPSQLEEFRLNIAPERLHDALRFAALYIGEGGTTASEAAILGVPALYVNSLPLMGYLKDEERAELLFHLKDPGSIFKKAIEILTNSDSTAIFRNNSRKLLEGKIDVTAFMVWFTENFPSSVRTYTYNQKFTPGGL